MLASRTTAPSARTIAYPRARVARGRERLEPNARPVEARAATLDEEPRCGNEPLAASPESRPVPLERPCRSVAEPLARALEPRAELVEVGDDEPRRGGRRRGADIRGQVAERLVLLVADGGDDRNGAARDGAYDALVAEGQQVLEAPAAAREDDDVDALAPRERVERARDRDGRERALHPRLRDDEPHGGKAGRDRGDDIAARSGIDAGQEADRAREARQPALAL